MSNDAPVTDAPDDFVSLLLAHQRGIYSFLVTLLPFEADLDDLFQQVCLALWQKRADYDATRPFLPWAYAFARHAALKHLKSRTRDRAVIPIGMETLERIAMGRVAEDPVIEARRSALEQHGDRRARVLDEDRVVAFLLEDRRVQRRVRRIGICDEGVLAHDFPPGHARRLSR